MSVATGSPVTSASPMSTTSAPARAVVRDVGGGEHRGLGDLHGIRREVLGQASEQVAVELEGRQVARVDADEPGADVGGALQLVDRVRLDERRHAELDHERVQLRQQRLLERGDDQQHQVGTGRAGLEHLVRRGDEVLAQHRHRHGRPDGLEVGEAALEAAFLGEHGDRGGSPGLVQGRLQGGVGDRGEVAARRARALDLGDDLHPVCGRERRSASRAGAGESGLLDLGERAQSLACSASSTAPAVRSASMLSAASARTWGR